MWQEMEKLQARGELGEEELRALEEDVTGKVRPLLAFVSRELCAHQASPDHARVMARHPL